MTAKEPLIGSDLQLLEYLLFNYYYILLGESHLGSFCAAMSLKDPYPLYSVVEMNKDSICFESNLI